MKSNQKNSPSQLSLLPVNDPVTKPVFLGFDGADISSDGGVLALREVESQIKLLAGFAKVIDDPRDARYTKHDVYELLLQRVSQIACGYEDGNDCDRLRDDPVFKMAAGRQPQSGDRLASQPTHSRFENATTARRALYRLANQLAESFIKSYASEPEVIVLDFDDTEDRVHGAQQLALFNGYFGERCFMPLHVYEGLSGKLIATLLRSGKRMTGKQIRSVLKRLVQKIRQSWPDTLIIFRGDSHFACPEVFLWIEEQRRVRFVAGLAGNAVLLRRVEDLVKQAKERYRQTGNKVKRYHAFFYKAQSWRKPERIIAKIEVNEKGDNIRFVVTDLANAKATLLYQDIYCARARAELCIKDHKLYLKSDRTSCSRFAANQFRLFLHSAAYVLMHALRANLLRNTRWEKATFATIRLRILKIGAQVRELKTRIKVEFPASCPVKNELQRAFRVLEILRSSA